MLESGHEAEMKREPKRRSKLCMRINHANVSVLSKFNCEFASSTFTLSEFSTVQEGSCLLHK